MNTRWIICTALAAGSLLLGAAGAALAQGNHCGGTANFAKQACDLEAEADHAEAYAICRNLPTNRERVDCREEADEELQEALRSGDESCRAQRMARADVCRLFGQERYDPSWEPEDFVDPDTIGDTVAPNPWLSLVPGTTQIIRAGEEGEEWVIQYVTTDTEEVDGVTCRTVVDLEFAPDEDDEEESEDGSQRFAQPNDIVIDGEELEIIEYTDDWYAQDIEGNVWYCGELSREFEDGDLASLDGSFKAGEDGDKPGLLMPAMPMVGDAYRQEWSVNNAEDYAEVIGLAGGPDTEVEGYECNGSCLVTREATPLEPESEELKYWLQGTGFVLAEEPAEDGEPTEREELICVGAALEDCVTDPDILEELCEIAPDAFCDDEDAPASAF
jgi:hypothetical protein